MSTKTNATKTTTTNATKTNKKVTEILSYNDTLQLFIDNGLRVASDEKLMQKNVYIGYGKRFNDFSVNVKKTQYNIFCIDEMFEKCENIANQLKNTVFIKNGNSSQRINNKIECKSSDDLLKMLLAIKIA